MYKKITSVLVISCMLLLVIENYVKATTSTVESNSLTTDSTIQNDASNNVISSTTGGGAFETKDENTKSIYTKTAEKFSKGIESAQADLIEISNQAFDKTKEKVFDEAVRNYERASGKKLSDDEKTKLKKTVDEKVEEEKKLAQERIKNEVKTWLQDEGVKVEGDLQSNIEDWIKEKAGRTIDDGVDTVLDIALKQPLIKQIDNLIGKDNSPFVNILNTTLSGYFDARTEDARMEWYNKVRKKAGLPDFQKEADKETENFDWKYTASKAALNELNSEAVRFMDNFEKNLTQKLADMIGGDIGQGAASLLGNYVGSITNEYLKLQFDKWADDLRTSLKGSKFTDKEIEEAIAGLKSASDEIAVKNTEQMKKEALQKLEDAKRKAYSDELEKVRKEALTQLADNTGSLASSYATKIFDKIEQQVQVFKGSLGKILNSYTAGLVRQVKAWAGENIKKAVSDYVKNIFFGKDGKIDTSKIGIDWQNALTSTLLTTITDENMAQYLQIALEEIKKPGGFVGGKNSFEEYNQKFYMFMIVGGRLHPSLNNISSKFKGVAGLAPNQFSTMTDTVLTRYFGSPNTMANTDAAARGLMVTRILPTPVPQVRTSDTTNTIAIVNPLSTLTMGGGYPKLSDTAYVLCEMQENKDYNSYVQQALSHTSLYTGTRYALNLQSSNLYAEAVAFSAFTALSASHGGYGKAIQDLTDVATARYNRQSKVYIVGPFKVNYIRDFIYTLRGKAEFGLMVDMNIYDQKGRQIPRNYWSFIYSDDSKKERKKFDETYRFPYPGEDFYIALFNYGGNDITSISKIELTYREMQVLVKAQTLSSMYNTYVWYDFVTPIPHPHAPTTYRHTIKAARIPKAPSLFGLSVNFAHKYYLTHIQTITLHKKDAKAGYETAQFTTTSSTSIGGMQMISAAYGESENSGLYNSLKSVTGNMAKVGMYSSTGISFLDATSQVVSIYKEGGDKSAFFKAAQSVLAIYGKEDWAKIINIAGVINDPESSRFDKLMAVSNYVVKSESMRQVIQAAGLVQLYKKGDASHLDVIKYVAKVTKMPPQVTQVVAALDAYKQIKGMDTDMWGIMAGTKDSKEKIKEAKAKILERKDLSEEDKKRLLKSVEDSVNVIENTPYGKFVAEGVLILQAGKNTKSAKEMADEIFQKYGDKLVLHSTADGNSSDSSGQLEIESKQKEQTAKADKDDAGLTFQAAYRLFWNLYDQSQNSELFLDSAIETYNKIENGEEAKDAVVETYRETPNEASRAVSQFLEVSEHMTEEELNTMSVAISKAADINDVSNVLDVYQKRNDLLTDQEKQQKEARAFQETIDESAVLNDDSIYTEYNPKFTITNVERPTQVYWANDDEVGFTIGIAGVVWKDAHGGLENNYDGIRGANANGQLETGIEGVKVTLIDRETNTIGKYYDARNNLVDATTYTDEGGYYHIERVPVGEYDVEFEYDGETYKSTTLLAGGNVTDYSVDPNQEKYDNNSKAAEDPDERIAFNNKFSEIIDGYAIGTDGTKTPLSYDKTDGVSKLVTLDSAGHVLPQFAMHARTSTNGITYPLDDNFTVGEHEDTLVLNGNQYTFYNTGEHMYHVNLGLVERSKIDLGVTQDVYNTVTTVNQKQETYQYNARGILDVFDAKLKRTDSYRNVNYNRELYKADYNYRINDYKMNDLNKLDRNGDDKSTEIEKIQEVKAVDEQEKVFVTYKITVKNQSILQAATVNELVDYYDPTYRLLQDDYYLDIQNDEGVPISTRVATQSYYETSSGDTHRIKWSETGKTSTDYYPGLNTIYTTDLQDYILKAGEEIYVYMTFEVEKGANDALELGQKQSIVEITNYSSFEIGAPDKSMPEGLIDKDSEPGNTNPYAIDDYEDDNDAAPILDLKLYETNGRTLDGYVWDDDRTQTLKTGQVVGDGIRQKEEDLINGVRVQLVEKIDNPENGEEYEYVWKEIYTGDDNYSYVIHTGNSVNSGGDVSDSGNIVSDTTLGAVERGQYKFNEYIAGNFIVRFIYGDTAKTYLNDTEVESSDGENTQIGQNPVSYNGQDYKSTAYQEGRNINEKWYDLNNNTQNDELISDAKDDATRRKKVIAYSATIQNNKAEVLASFDTRKDKGYYDASKHQALRDNTWMFADTARFNVKVEYNKDWQSGLKTKDYRIRNIDFGLEQRPETKIEINKEITGIKVKLASGETIIDTANGINKNVNWINKKKTGVEGYEYKRDTFRYRYEQGTVHIYMDEEVLQGAFIEISYRLTITNKSQIDYTGDGDDLGLTYYTGQVYDSDKIVTTTVDKIIDYVDNSLVFKESENSNDGWKLVETMPEFLTDDYKKQQEDAQKEQQKQEEQSYGKYIEQQMKKYGEDYVYAHLSDFEKQYQKWKEKQNTKVENSTGAKKLSNTEVVNCMKQIGFLDPNLEIVKTKSGKTEKAPITQVIVTKKTEKTDLKPGDSTTVDLVLSKTLSPQDEADTLSYQNIVEILQLSNSVGRRDMDALAGNQDPNGEPKEYDADFVEKVIITPPTGGNKAYYFVLGAIILIVLAGGIILIKKKVFGKGTKIIK